VNGRCECGGCGRVFTGLTAFDRHRRNFRCVDPASVGLEQKPNGIWGWPPDARSRSRHAAQSAEQGRTHTPGTPPAPRPAKSSVEASRADS
jgi:hypothetical protein